MCEAQTGNPLDELCDNLDNDCDGETDEIFTELGENCTSGLGECSQPGTYICSNDSTAVTCDAVPLEAGEEQCGNSKDDDCDGTVDEGCDCDNGTTRDCDPGWCTHKGTQTCSDGKWGSCEIIPETEVCNGIDDDCDGNIDNGFDGLGDVCEDGTGECKVTGTYICNDDEQMVCSESAKDSEQESCDGLDNDCDGNIDNNCKGPGGIIINEIFYDEFGGDGEEVFIELYGESNFF